MITTEQLLVFTVLTGALALFAWGRIRYDLVAVLAMLVLALAGVVPGSEAFAGFGHPAVITVAVVLALSRALQASGVIERLVETLDSVPAGAWLQSACITGTGAVLSAFMNNVGALALMLPVALKLGARYGIPVYALLMPLAFGSLLGGLCTLIGTPPNVIIATFRREELGAAFSMFDFAPVGVPVMILGVAAIASLAPRLLPVRRETPANEDLAVEDYTTELVVTAESGLAGVTVAALKERVDEKFEIIALIRGKERTSAPGSRRQLKENDTLLVKASATALEKLVDRAGLSLIRMPPGELGVPDESDAMIAEAVVKPDALVAGRSARDARLHARFGLAVLGVAREGRRLRTRPADVRLKAGDVILIEGDAESMRERLGEIGCLPLAERTIRVSSQSTYLTPALFGLAIVGVAAGAVRLEIGLALALAAIVLLRQLSLRELYQSIDWPVIVLLAAMLPVGKALHSSGGATVIAQSVLSLGSGMPSVILIALVAMLAMAISNLVNNAATALLMAPIAVDVARGLDASPDPFLMAVAVGSSCAFMTPIGHQSNLLVMGPGGYRFSDYWRLGLPLSVLVVVVASPLIAWVFPP